MAYLDPYQRPAPDRFVRRWLFITACIAALMLLWQFLPAIEAWFSPREAAERTVMARGDLAADEKTTIELFEKSRASVVYITTAQLVRDVWTRNVFSVPRGTWLGLHLGRRRPRRHQLPRHPGRVRSHRQTGRRPRLPGRAGGDEPRARHRRAQDRRRFQAPAGRAGRHQCRPQGGSEGVCYRQPLRPGLTLTTGIVSALDRSLPGEAGGPAIDHLIQTDAAINPGNSGGPLLDSAGRLIGINTAIYSPSGASAGIGFAVPVDTVMRVVPQLIKTGKYIRPALGIEVDEQLNTRLQALTGSKGVFVLRVTPGSAAHRAGLVGVEVTAGGIVPGDRVISIDGIAVDDVTTLQARLDDKNVGDVVVLLVERAGKTREMLVELQPGV